MLYLAKNLKFLRKKFNYSQREMLDIIGIMPTTWSNYENSQSEPTLIKIIEISKLFGVTLDDLLMKDLENVHLTTGGKEKTGQAKSTPKSTPNSTPNVTDNRDEVHEADHRYGQKDYEITTLWYVLKEVKALRQQLDEMRDNIEKKGD